MNELRAAIEAMARAHRVEPTQQLVSRYLVHLAGYRQDAAVSAVRSASRRNSRLPKPAQVVAHVRSETDTTTTRGGGYE